MRFSFLSSIFLMIISSFSLIGTAMAGSATLTAYSGGCKHDKWGGPNTSSSGLKPRDFTLDGQSPLVMVAVPQRGGTAHLYGCVFELEGFDKKFFAADRYDDGSQSGIDSNGKNKIDISHECTPSLNNFKKESVSFTTISCFKGRQALRTAVQGLTTEPPPLPSRKPANF